MGLEYMGLKCSAVNFLCSNPMCCAVMCETCFRHKPSCRSTMPHSVLCYNLLRLSPVCVMSETCFRHKPSCRSTMPHSVYAMQQQGQHVCQILAQCSSSRPHDCTRAYAAIISISKSLMLDPCLSFWLQGKCVFVLTCTLNKTSAFGNKDIACVHVLVQLIQGVDPEKNGSKMWHLRGTRKTLDDSKWDSRHVGSHFRHCSLPQWIMSHPKKHMWDSCF